MLFFIPPQLLRTEAERWLSEDFLFYDFSSSVGLNEDQIAYIYGKSKGILAGIPFMQAIFETVGCRVSWNYSEGSYIEPMAAVGTVEGKSSSLLHAERTALNILSRASGIASKAFEINQLKLKHGWNGTIAGTRKTTPGLRFVEKYSLAIGGVSMHRNDLSHLIMLKDNHVYLLREKGISLKEIVTNLRQFHGPFCSIEIELSSADDFDHVISANPNIILLDNMTSDLCIKLAIQAKALLPSLLIEASGGINESNICQYFHDSIDIISCGSLTTNQNILDFSMKFEKFGPFI